MCNSTKKRLRDKALSSNTSFNKNLPLVFFFQFTSNFSLMRYSAFKWIMIAALLGNNILYNPSSKQSKGDRKMKWGGLFIPEESSATILQYQPHSNWLHDRGCTVALFNCHMSHIKYETSWTDFINAVVLLSYLTASLVPCWLYSIALLVNDLLLNPK